MITNHIIVWRPTGDLTVFGALAHSVYFHAKLEIAALRTNGRLRPGRQFLCRPEPISGLITARGFLPVSWSIGELVEVGQRSALQEGELLIEIRGEPTK